MQLLRGAYFLQEPALHSTIVPDCGFRRHLRFELIVTEVRQRGIHPYREILKWPTRDLVGIFDLFGSEVHIPSGSGPGRANRRSIRMRLQFLHDAE